MQSDPPNIWSGDGQSSRSTQPTHPVFQPVPSQPAQPTQLQYPPQSNYQPAPQPQPKPKLNKTIIYSAVAAATVVLLVAGVFGAKWFLYTIG